MNYRYWAEEDIKNLESVTSYAEIADIALRVLEKMPQPVCEACGPISTGGRGSLEENLKAFDEVLISLMGQGENIFDPRAFEPAV